MWFYQDLLFLAFYLFLVDTAPIPHSVQVKTLLNFLSILKPGGDYFLGHRNSPRNKSPS